MKEEYLVTVEFDHTQTYDDQYGTGMYLREEWTLDGVIHRTFGPAVTLRHPITFKPVREEFFQNGKWHRYGGPALIIRDPATDAVAFAEFYERGKMIRPRDSFAPNRG